MARGDRGAGGTPGGASGGALGMLETVGLVAAVEAADAMLKTSEVRLVRQQRTVPGLVTHVVAGDTAAVRSAVDAGAAAAERVGRVAGRHVIPSPDPSVWRRLVGVDPDTFAAPPGAALEADSEGAGDADLDGADPDDYPDRTVRELRSMARDRDDEDFSGRTISAASKDDLVAFLRRDDGRAGGARP